MVFRSLTQSLSTQRDPMLALNPLLKSVARTFYLSLSHLPAAIQQPLSLAYLLARLADTIVDVQTVPLELRIMLLSRLRGCVQEPHHEILITEMSQQIQEALPYFSYQNAILLESTESLLTLLSEQPSAILTLIQQVLLLIFEGQALDLNYFDSRSGIVHFKTEQELDRYLYLVAGSVGEFWTKICLACIPNYTIANLDKLLPKAIAFGKALQLTNILRDLRQDLQNGRCYLPIAADVFSEESRDHSQDLVGQLLVHDPMLIYRWTEQAKGYLDDAKTYTDVITNRRIRFSTLVPMQLAHKTLARLPIKLSKTSVYRTVIASLLQAYSPLARVQRR